MSTTIKISLKDRKVTSLKSPPIEEEESELNTDRMETWANLEEENVMLEDATDSQMGEKSKTLRKSRRESKKRFFYLSEDDYEQENNDAFIKNNEKETPYDDIDDFLNDGSEENTNITTENNIEVKQNIDTYEKIKEKLSQKKKKSKKKKKFPLEPDEDYAPDEVD